MKQDQILAALPSLKPQALKAIRAACDVLLGQAPMGGSRQAAQAPEAWAYEALLAALGLSHMPFSRFAAMPAGRQFTSALPGLLAFLQRAFSAEALGKRARANALLRFTYDLLISDLKRQNIPVTLNTLTSNLHRAPTVFSNAFPGYLESGLGQEILKAMNENFLLERK